MIFKIAVSGISVYSSKKSYEALESFLLSFRPAFYRVPIPLQARGYTADPKINEFQSCKKQLLLEWRQRRRKIRLEMVMAYHGDMSRVLWKQNEGDTQSHLRQTSGGYPEQVMPHFLW